MKPGTVQLDTVTQARRLSEIQEMADDCAALWLDVDASVIDVRVTIEIPETFRTDWESAQAKATQARAVEAQAPPSAGRSYAAFVSLATPMTMRQPCSGFPRHASTSSPMILGLDPPRK
ncbi:hypothetical protein [Cryobacterium aureum]|uniref:hypothetical protein n=1 Tax=Cryobacterium aureum TaxID=995037 RepID=UPI000CF37E71|nr:hypothetical protein [Cryobacterium aureum]